MNLDAKNLIAKNFAKFFKKQIILAQKMAQNFMAYGIYTNYMDQEIFNEDVIEIYCIYSESKGNKYFLGLIEIKNDVINNYRFKDGKVNNDFEQTYYLLSQEDEQKNFERWTKIIKDNLKPDIIYFVKEVSQDKNKILSAYYDMLTSKKINRNVKERITKTINIKEGNGLNNNNLLQRIIRLEEKINDIQNKLNHDSSEDDINCNGFATAQNNCFTCSRCGRINPKFFNNDYPTLSEFRNQFSKL